EGQGEGNYHVGVQVATYDISKPLIIDPVLTYSTYLGGSNGGAGLGIAVDSAGNAYVAGYTTSGDFPMANPLQPQGGGSLDAFVTKVNPTGSALVYSTYLGGSNGEGGNGIAVDAEGNMYVAGQTSSTDFPTVNPLQPAFGGEVLDAFAAKIIDVIPVTIDIKPGSFPNSINLGSGGTVPVAIFSETTFDATTVDPTTVTLASAPVKLKGQGTPMASFEDVDRDELLDLVVHVETTALQLSETDTQAVLEGKTFGGTRIRGVDTVRIIP
ncbi:MAG: SBBP repeat-containing protein, partial [candidate division NC10 bacterium]|nr:SBBP repeat-containing protein [candidate division NC10 bacterium]